jgi:predicted  nucleic acid-binding Zn-ribbon protein
VASTADVSVFDDLLRVQEHDTAADRLRHRRDHLPEAAELRACEDDLAQLEAALAEVGARAAEAARVQRRLEAELASVEAKIAELDAKLYSGAVKVPRELQAMQGEGEALRARRSSLEDQVLEAMGDRDPLDAEVAGLEKRRAELDALGARLRAAVAEAGAVIDRELAAELEARESAAAGIPADLAALYEELRAHLGGVAAAPLVNGRCGGCHLALPATEIARLRKEPPDTLVRCEQCNRILVRP